MLPRKRSLGMTIKLTQYREAERFGLRQFKMF